MTPTRPRRKRAPVVSRLTLAWTAFAVLACGIALYAALWGANALRPQRIALAVAPDAETMARPEPITTRSALRPGAAGERFPSRLDEDSRQDAPDAGEPLSTEAEDLLAFGAPDTDDILEVPDDVVITIDGAPARAPGEGVAPLRDAALDRSVLSIPDAMPDLLQKTPLGRIPKISADGRRAADVYAKAWQGDQKRPKAALILGGLGLDPRLTARAIEELPPEVTLSFAPYARDLERWTAEARAAGHEIMIELPMEGYGGRVEALGPAALLTSRAAADNLQRLDWLLSRFGAYFGATNYFGGKFSADRDAIAPVAARLAALGVAYVDDTGAAGAAFAPGAGVTVVNQMIAPQGPGASLKEIERDLQSLERAARRAGDAIGKAYAYEAAIDAIAAWTGTLDEKGLALAPASAVLKARAGRS
jgi:hypothetical protein